MSEELDYDLATSEDIIGAIYPVLKSPDGEVLDGLHRLNVDPKWPVKVVEVKDEKRKLLVRVHANIQRRNIPTEEKEGWVKQARKVLQSEGKKGTQEEIAKLLGFSVNWVSKYDTTPVQPNRPHPQRKDTQRVTSEPPVVSHNGHEEAPRELPPIAPHVQEYVKNIAEPIAKSILDTAKAEKSLNNSKAVREQRRAALLQNLESAIMDGILSCPRGHRGRLVWSCCKAGVEEN